MCLQETSTREKREDQLYESDTREGRGHMEDSEDE